MKLASGLAFFLFLFILCAKMPVRAAGIDLENDSKNLSAAVLPLENDFSAGRIVAYIIFGAVGFAAFMYGKKNASWRTMVVGVALMSYPYFFSGTLALYLIGFGLCAALYFWREY